MSFSSDVKTEACKTGITRSCCATAEMYGLMLYATAFSCREIRITTSNPALIKRMPTLLSKALKIEMPAFAASAKTTFQLTDKSVLGKVFTAFGYEFKDTALHLNRAIIDDECCISSFLRGVFLSGGAVMNPDKKYHLEFSTNHLTLNREMISLLLDLDLAPKTLKRKNEYVIYLKDSGHIEDFLTIIGAPVCAMRLMQTKVEKELRNTVNRQVNCETANLSKTVNASLRQVNAIKKIDRLLGIATLDKQLYETAMLRLENQDATLNELKALSKTPVSKPGLNHRLRRLLELSDKLKEDKG